MRVVCIVFRFFSVGCVYSVRAYDMLVVDCVIHCVCYVGGFVLVELLSLLMILVLEVGW